MIIHTSVHTTFPLKQWQVLQSSSHFAPSRVTCPLTEQDFLVTEWKASTALELSHKLGFFFFFYHLVKTSTFLTLGTSSVWGTQAAISVDLIHTGGAKGTRRGLTLINVCHRGESKRWEMSPFWSKEHQTAYKYWVKPSAHKSNS